VKIRGVAENEDWRVAAAAAAARLKHEIRTASGW